MKYKTLKEKLYPFALQLFAEGEGSDGGKTEEGDDRDDEESDEDGEEDEKKYSQKEVDDAISKRIAREWKKWQRKQNASKEKDGANAGGSQKEETEDSKARKEAENKATRLEMKVACYEAGVAKDSVSDVAALARSYMADDEDLDLEDAIEKVVKKYPQFKTGAKEEKEEPDNPNKSWGRRQEGRRSKTDGVEAAFLRKNPGLKID